MYKSTDEMMKAVERRRAVNKKHYQDKVKPKRAKSKAAAAKAGPALPQEHRGYVKFRMPISIIARMGKMFHQSIASKEFAWATMSDMYEHIVKIGIQALGDDREGYLHDVAKYIRAVETVDSILKHEREAKVLFGKAKQAIAGLLEIGETKQARIVFWIHRQELFDLAPGPWRTWGIEQITKAFPKLAAHPIPPVSLDPKDAYDEAGDADPLHEALLERQDEQPRKKTKAIRR